MITTILIAAGILAIATYLFLEYFEEICEWADRMINKIIKWTRSVLVFAKKAGRIISKLYTKFINGTVEVKETTKELHFDDIPEEIGILLSQGKEVPVKEFVFST
jgi:hypothetical protein